jgi:hypothetical protein
MKAKVRFESACGPGNAERRPRKDVESSTKSADLVATSLNVIS